MRSTTALTLVFFAALALNSAAQEVPKPPAIPEAEATPAKRVTATYEASEIQNIAVKTPNGDVFFDAGKEHYCWRLRDGTRGENLQAAFLMADKLAQAAKIETMRFESSERNRSPFHDLYHEGTTYLFLSELTLHFSKREGAK